MAFHPKVAAGAIAAAITGVLVAELTRRGVPIDGAEGANITMIVTLAVSYFVSGEEAAPAPEYQQEGTQP